MTKKETVNRNIGLTFDFLRQVVEDPKMLESIPDGSTLEFLDKDFVQITREDKNDEERNTKYFRVTSHLEPI